MTCAIVVNSKSGTALDPEKLAAALARAAFQADVLDLQEMAGTGLERAAERYDVLVAAGGDGTVSTIAAAASAAGRTFGVIPSGTLNHFARDAGIPADLDEAIAVITRGRTRAMDVGDLNGRIFVNNASIGAYPRMVWERNRARGLGLPRPIAMGFAVARTWSGLRSLAVRIVVDGQVLVRKTPFIFIGNSEYDVTGTDVGSRPTMTDGKLSLYMAPRFGRRDALLMPVRVLRNTLESHERFEAMTASTISIETARKQVGVARDGEVGLFGPPLQFSVRRNALKVLVP